MPDEKAREPKPAPESSQRWGLSTAQKLATIAAAVVAIVATGVAPRIGWLGKVSGLFGDGEQPTETAQQFGERALRGYFTDAGEWYDVLHPAEKALVTRERFLDCERQAFFLARRWGLSRLARTLRSAVTLFPTAGSKRSLQPTFHSTSR
jgi:hypothetical protein